MRLESNRMMKSLVLLAVCALCYLVAPHVQAKEKIDIVDCFALMPTDVFVEWDSTAWMNPGRIDEIKSTVRRAVRQELSGFLVDIRNGYLHNPGDDGGERNGMTMTLFRQPDGSALIAMELRETWDVVELDVLPVHEELMDAIGDVYATSSLRFFAVDRIAWTDITDRVVPEPLLKDVRYELPRYGTTILLFRRGESKPFRKWVRDKDGFLAVTLK